MIGEIGVVRLAVHALRQSPWIPASVPIHGLMVDIESGRLDWVLRDERDPAPTPTLRPAGAADPGEPPLPPPWAPEPPSALDRPLPPIGHL
jgi:hypothetical protein